MRRLATALAILMIVLSLTPSTPVISQASPGRFEVVYVSFRSSAGEDVYPGSQGAELIVETQYMGSMNATNVYARITSLPPGLNLSDTATSPAYSPSGGVVDRVSSGMIVDFRFTIDVDRSVAPGTYMLTLNITYALNPAPGTLNLTYEVHYVNITISPYPPLTIGVVDVYWEPYGYPGMADASLVVEVRNTGDSRITGGTAEISLPSIINPNTSRASIPSIQPDQMGAIRFTGLDILATASPGSYNATLTLRAELSTADGVRYNDTSTLGITITIDKPPAVRIRVLDYGLTADYVYDGLRSTRIYITIRSIDPATLRSIVARVDVENAFFTNGSQSDIATVRGPIGYGDTFTILTDTLSIASNASYITAHVTLDILCQDGNAMYWNTTSISLYIRVPSRNLSIYVESVYWLSSRVYPGSTGESLAVRIANLEQLDISNALAELTLPKGFTPQELYRDQLSIAGSSITRIVFNGISIDEGMRPGNYTARLLIKGIMVNSDGSYKWVELNYTIPVEVSQANTSVLELVYAGWSTGKAYSNSTGDTIELLYRVSKPVTVERIILRALYPEGVFSRSTGSHYDILVIDGPYGYGDTFTSSLGPLTISSSVTGQIPVFLETRILLSINGAETWVNTSSTIVMSVHRPRLNVTIIDYGWSSGRASNYTDNARIYVTLQSLSLDTIENAIVKLVLHRGARASDGGRALYWSLSAPVGYGDTFTASFSRIHIETNASSINATVTIIAELSAGGTRYWATLSRNITLGLSSAEKTFILAGTRSLYNNRPAPILPTAHDIVYEITLINMLGERVSSISYNVSLPAGIKAVDKTGSCIYGAAGGTACTITLRLDVGDIAPGVYRGSLSLLIVKDLGGSIVIDRQRIPFSIAVASPDCYKPDIRVVDAYWGAGSPTHVYAGDRRAPLTIVLANYGRYPASAVTVSLSSSDAVFLSNTSACASTLAPSAVCQAIFYADLGYTNTSVISLDIRVSYIQGVYGAHIQRVEEHHRILHISSFQGSINSSDIIVVDAGWSNDWPVYPGTKGAIYTLVLANTLPYSIGGVEAVIKPPRGFKCSDGYTCRAYVEGPIAPLQELTLSFKLDAVNASPGLYVAIVSVSYYIDSGGPGLRRSIEFPLPIEVSDPGRAVEYIASGWIGGSPLLSEKSASFYFMLRNNEYPSMGGIVIRIKLPRGITSSLTNGSTANITPSILPGLQIQGITGGRDVASLLQLALSQPQAGSSASASKGDYVYAVTKLNLELPRPGLYYANATITFIDHWGELAGVNITIPIPVYGGLQMIRVSTAGPLVFINSTATLRIVVENLGEIPVYNVYIIAAPVYPLAMPLETTRYIGSLEPGESAIVNYTLVYNPALASTAAAGIGVASTIQASGVYGSLPVRVAVVYRDELGSVSMYNTTIAAEIKPFIDIMLSRDVTVKYRDGLLAVSGLIINYGLSGAHSLEVRMIYGNRTAYSFIGDIDPASQTVFRLELPVERLTSRSIIVELYYRDDYSNEYVKRYILNITEISEVPTATATRTVAPEITSLHMIVIGLIAAFLAGVFYVIWRLASKHMKSLER